MRLEEKLKVRRQAIELLEGAGMREPEEPGAPKEVVVCESEEEFLAAIGEQDKPIQVTHKSVKQRRERLLHRVFDGVERTDVEAQAATLGLERAAKVISQLDNSKDVKIDHTISAMALIGMFPVATETD